MNTEASASSPKIASILAVGFFIDSNRSDASGLSGTNSLPRVSLWAGTTFVRLYAMVSKKIVHAEKENKLEHKYLKE